MKNTTINRVNGDLISFFQVAKEIDWNNINKLSIYRILYLSSVMYTFVYPELKNPFEKDYNFIIDLHGPYCDKIEQSIIFLTSNQYIIRNKSTGLLTLGYRKLDGLERVEGYTAKKQWVKILIYIMNIYDEDKIYEFVFRDPEYQEKLLTKDPSGIDITNENETRRTLNEFRLAFENNIDDLKDTKVDPKKYVELYFEYIFSIILKGDV